MEQNIQAQLGVADLKVSTPHFRLNPAYRSGSHAVYRSYYRDKREKPTILMNVASTLGIAQIIHFTRNIDGIDEIASFFNQIKGIIGASLATGVFTAGAPFVGFGTLGMLEEVGESREEKVKLLFAKKESQKLLKDLASEYGYRFSEKAMESKELFLIEADVILKELLERARSSLDERKAISKSINRYVAGVSDYTKSALLHRALKYDHRGSQIFGFPAMFLMFTGMLSGITESATKIAFEAGNKGLENAVASFNIATTSIFAPANLLMAMYAGVRFKGGLMYRNVLQQDRAALKHFMKTSTSLNSITRFVNQNINLSRRSRIDYGAATALFQSMLTASGVMALMNIAGGISSSAAALAPPLAGIGAAGAIMAVAHRIRADYRSEKMLGDADAVLEEDVSLNEQGEDKEEAIRGRFNFEEEYEKIGSSSGYKNRHALAEILEQEFEASNSDLVKFKTLSLVQQVLRNRSHSFANKNYDLQTVKQREAHFEKRVSNQWYRVGNVLRKAVLMGSRTTLDMDPILLERLRQDKNIAQYKYIFSTVNPFTRLLNEACKGILENEKGVFDAVKIEKLLLAMDAQNENNALHNIFVNKLAKKASVFEEKYQLENRYFLKVENHRTWFGKKYQTRSGFKFSEFLHDASLPENKLQREAFASAVTPLVIKYFKNAAKVKRADAVEYMTKLAREDQKETEQCSPSTESVKYASSSASDKSSNQWDSVHLNKHNKLPLVTTRYSLAKKTPETQIQNIVEKASKAWGKRLSEGGEQQFSSSTRAV